MGDETSGDWTDMANMSGRVTAKDTSKLYQWLEVWVDHP